MSRMTAALFTVSCLSGGATYALDTVKEVKGSFIFNGERVKIDRYNPESAHLATRFASSTDDAGKLVTNLLAQGYPSEEIHYYLSGMQVWSILGFSTEEGTS